MDINILGRRIALHVARVQIVINIGNIVTIRHKTGRVARYREAKTWKNKEKMETLLSRYNGSHRSPPNTAVTISKKP